MVGRWDDAGAHEEVEGGAGGQGLGGGAPTVLAASGTATLVEEGALHLRTLDEALPGLVSRAGQTQLPFTLVLARPGPSASPGRPAPVASAGDVEDLAASLSVSLNPMQALYRAGAGYLAVIVPGRSGTGQREAMRLTRRAAGEGAPLFTWAAARFPRDAATAAGLLEVAYSRLDGRLVSHAEPVAARTPERGTGRYGAAIWAAVGAAVLVGLVAFALRGSGPTPHVAFGNSPGQPGATSGADSGAAGAQGGSGTNGGGGTSGFSGGSGGSGSGGSGFGGSGVSSSGGGGGGTSGGSGTGPNLGGPQAGAQQPGTPGVPTTVPSSATTLPVSTSLPISTSTTLPNVNSGTTTTTTATGSSACTGLVQSLVCQANNLLGSLGH